MTLEEKKVWMAGASPAELLRQFRSMVARAERMEFGMEFLALQEDIELTQAELLRRLGLN